ncbi:MAG: T9SS type A sorting domain-containing protein [Bacteroidota bacterium]
MKTVIALSILISCAHWLNAQSFIELCDNQNTSGTVVDFESHNGELYATGFFQQICGQTVNYIAQWDGSTWGPGPFTLSDPGHSLRSIGGQLYVARYEESIDSNWVFVFDGNTLNKVGEGVYLTTATNFSNLPNIYDIAEYNGQLVACGEFDRVGTASISGIMRWNGTNWEELGGGLSGNIPNNAPIMFPHQLLVDGDALYVIGNFRNAGGVEVNGIAKWENEQWTAMGSGFNSTVYSIGKYQGELYAGGAFTQSGDEAVNRIAKWDGTKWISPGFGFNPLTGNDFIFVHTMREIAGTFYLLGGLKQIEYADGTTENCGGIVAYSGTTPVETFAGGVSGNDLEAIALENDQLLIGGGVFNNGYVGVLGTTTSTNGPEDIANVLNVYPNPVSDQLAIESETPIQSIRLMDVHGQLIERFETHRWALPFGHLPQGLYWIAVQTTEGIQIRKVIKQ